MGVKSTIELSRQDAENRLIELQLITARKLLTKHVKGLSDEKIAKDLERIHDAAHDGEGYENYRIIS